EWCEAGDESWEYPVTPCRSSFFAQRIDEPVREQRNNENLSLCHLNAQKAANHYPSQFRSFAVSHNKMVQDAKKTSQRACLKRLDHYPLYMQPPVNAQPRDVDTFLFVLPTGGNEATPQAESVSGELAEGGLFVKGPTGSGVFPVRESTCHSQWSMSRR
ncbi:hypothetical protein CMEL01_02897, partial [Colletotrichum melonis]